MKKIAVVDDRVVDRELVVEALNDAIEEMSIQDEWRVIETDPLADPDEYGPWINNNNIDILIIDERLFEASTGLLQSGPLGSAVVERLRTTHKGLPILGMSATIKTKELEDRYSLFDEVIVRDELSRDPMPHLKRLMRLSTNLIEDNKNQLAELSTLSEKIATKNASSEDIEKAKAIQQALSIPVTAPSIASRQGWIDEYRVQVERLEELGKKIEEIAKGNDSQ